MSFEQLGLDSKIFTGNSSFSKRDASSVTLHLLAKAFSCACFKSITKKPAETRMGKGKGSPEYWVAVVKPGRILFEIDGLEFNDAQEAFRICSHKLPIKTKTVPTRILHFLIED